MKKVLIGGFLSLIGTIWSLAIIIFAGNNLASSWYTPPGRFLTTVIETGMMVPLIFAFVVFLIGIVMMGVEHSKKDE